MSCTRSVCCVLAVIGFFTSPSLGAFLYGNLIGDTVVYQQVTEDSTTDPGVALFGAPSVVDDSLVFSPVSFGASATGAGGLDITDGTLAATIQAIGPDRGIEEVRFSERGDYTLAGSGTRATSVMVGAALFVRITHVNGASVTPITANVAMVFNPSGGTYNLIDDPGFVAVWDGAVSVDLDAMVAGAGLTGRATKVDISLDNQLLALSEAGTVAYIKKKQFEGVTITAIIPEPATVLLIGFGGLLARRRAR